MRDLDLVVFDVSGTLIQNTGAVADTFTAVLQARGIEIAAEELQPWRGASKRTAIRSLLRSHSPAEPSDEQVEKACTEFHDRLRQRFGEEPLQLIPGAEETLAWLRERAVRLALNTGFDRELADLILQALRWDQGTVDAMVCGDEVPQGRPAPFMIFRAMEKTGAVNVRRVAVVGDTALDLQAGYNAGSGWIIGVLSGAHTLQRLRELPHSRIVASVAELPELWNDE